jgi:hypothetical protein
MALEPFKDNSHEVMQQRLSLYENHLPYHEDDAPALSSL